MTKELDCRGLNCPEPVMRVRDLLAQESVREIAVKVDNDAALQNVYRFLEHQGFLVSVNRQGNAPVVSGTRSGDAPAPAPPDAPVTAAGRVGKRKIMVLVTSKHLGHGDDELGDMLLFNFLKTLKEMGPDLWRIAFVNSGVTFVAEGSDALPVLQELSDAGVAIAACGVCLAFYHLIDSVQVGEVTNMLEIVTAMKEADSVITV